MRNNRSTLEESLISMIRTETAGKILDRKEEKTNEIEHKGSGKGQAA
jgi:hypothetical protein